MKELYKRLFPTAMKLELLILNSVFEPICTVTHRVARPGFMIWSCICIATFVISVGMAAYRGLATEHDSMIIVAAAMIIFMFIIPNMKRARKAFYEAYEHATWGLENPNKDFLARVRTESMLMCLSIIMFWIPLSIKSGYWNLPMLAVWINLQGYPFYAFCSCSLPDKKF